MHSAYNLHAVYFSTYCTIPFLHVSVHYHYCSTVLRLYASYITMVLRKYLPQTQEIKDAVQHLVSAGIPDFKHNQMWLDFRGNKVKNNLDNKFLFNVKCKFVNHGTCVGQ